MPTTLTDSSSFDAMTAPIGTDIRNAASVRTCLQAAANRDRFVYDMVTPLADIAALKAISAPADGTVRSVVGHGAYVFLSSYVGAETLPWVVSPDVGSGQWVSMAASLAGYEGGIEKHHAPLADIAALKSVTGQDYGDTRLVIGEGIYVFRSSAVTEDVPLIVSPNVGLGRWYLASHGSNLHKLAETEQQYCSVTTTHSTTYQIAGDAFVSANVGDILVIDAWALAAGPDGNLAFGVLPAGGGGESYLQTMALSEPTKTMFVANMTYKVVTAGNTFARIWIKSDDGVAEPAVFDGHIRIQKFRR